MTIHTIKLNVTEKEIELVTLIADGYTSSEISKKLSINKKTIEANIAVIKSKFHSKNITNLVATFLRNKLID